MVHFCTVSFFTLFTICCNHTLKKNSIPRSMQFSKFTSRTALYLFSVSLFYDQIILWFQLVSFNLMFIQNHAAYNKILYTKWIITFILCKDEHNNICNDKYIMFPWTWNWHVYAIKLLLDSIDVYIRDIWVIILQKINEN
jgi:hypothetical protein